MSSHPPGPALVTDAAADDPVTLLVTAWLSAGRSENTRAAYARDIGITPPRRPGRAPSWLAWCGQQGVHPVTGVTVLHVARYARQLDDTGLSPASAARKLAAISSWYAWLARRGHISASPAAGATRPRATPTASPAPGLTQAQALRLLHAADQAPGPQAARTAALTAVLLFTGARLSEIITADIADLGTRQDHPVLWVTRGKNHRQGLPLPGPAATRIDAYLAGRTSPQDIPVLFATATGRRLFPADVRRTVRRLATRAGLPPELASHLGPRTLRHTSATLNRQAQPPQRHQASPPPGRQARDSGSGPWPRGRPHCRTRQTQHAAGHTRPRLPPPVTRHPADHACRWLWPAAGASAEMSAGRITVRSCTATRLRPRPQGRIASMGKAARVRREREHGRRRTRPLLSMVFADVDYDRASRAHGRRVAPSPPEAWAIGRSGLVHAEWDGVRLRETGTELITGPHPASSLVRALEGRQVIVGHGILTSDLRATVMVTDVPDSLLSRVIDTLAFAWRIRGGRFPTGCSLSTLVAENLGADRQKPRYPASAPGLRSGMDPSPCRGDHDPRADARLVAALWERWVTTRQLSWGAGKPSWTCEEGRTRDGSPGGTAMLADEQAAELTGYRPHAEADRWRSAYRWGMNIDPPTAPLLASLSAADLPAPTAIRAMAKLLQGAGMIPAGLALTDEDLYTACQYLGAKQNIEVRERIASGRGITRPLREPLAWALWQVTHPEWAVHPWTMAEKHRIRSRLEMIVS